MRYNVIREYLQKLKNKKGSALLVSLLFSVISIIIATVILNAAVTSSRRVTETAESSQPYYLVSSLFSVFEFEASSPKQNLVQVPPVNPNCGMEFTADLQLDPGGAVAASILLNSPYNGTGSLAAELDSKTNLDTLKNYVAYCLTGAMLSGSTAEREFTVDIGYDASGASPRSRQYEMSGRVSVNSVDYTVQVTVTGIQDVTDPANPVTLGLPEICTLAFPTEKVEVLRTETIGGKKRPTKARFIYQKAKYISIP